MVNGYARVNFDDPNSCYYCLRATTKFPNKSWVEPIIYCGVNNNPNEDLDDFFLKTMEKYYNTTAHVLT